MSIPWARIQRRFNAPGSDPLQNAAQTKNEPPGKLTLPKANVAPENGGFQYESPFPEVYFQMLYWFQGG